MQVVVLLGPPRCGLHAIARLLAEAEGMFTCELPKTAQLAESMLYASNAVIRCRVKDKTYSLPSPYRAVPLPASGVMKLQDCVCKEAQESGWNGTDVLVVTERLLFPFKSLIELSTFVWVHRSPEGVEKSCCATKWMPQFRPGRWCDYAATMNRTAMTMRPAHVINSNHVFAGRTHQVRRVVESMHCKWTDSKIGGKNAN